MPRSCPQCSVALLRSRRRGFVERFLLSPFPSVRPFRCPKCRYRRLLFTHRPSQSAVLLLLLTILAGVLLVQTLLFVSDRAGSYSDSEYQPKDLDRFHYMKKKSRE
jgi:hypothetical protein